MASAEDPLSEDPVCAMSFPAAARGFASAAALLVVEGDTDPRVRADSEEDGGR